MGAKLNVGVVGCGYWGPNLIRNFNSLHDCNLKAVCDLSVERLRHMQSLYPHVEVYNDYTRFLEDAGLDAVVVATSVRLHHPMCKAALLAGKHVMVEKPMAASSAECDDLEQIARSKGLTIMVGHTFLYSPIVRRIKKIVDDGDLGEIRYISARRLNLGLFQKDINVTWDLAPHDISIILYILGENPISVNCRGGANVSKNVHDVTTLWLGFSRNRSATIHSSWLDPRKTREMTIVGSKRMIVYDDVANQDKIRIYDARVESPPHYDTFAEFHYAYHYGDSYVPYVRQEEPLKIECQHFIDCIKTKTEPISGAKAARNVVRILEASSLSLARDGAPVEFAITPAVASETTGPGVTSVVDAVVKANVATNGDGQSNGHGRGSKSPTTGRSKKTKSSGTTKSTART
jgi:predicted dehydrogenase